VIVAEIFMVKMDRIGDDDIIFYVMMMDGVMADVAVQSS